MKTMPSDITKELLEKLYVIEGKSYSQIAKLIGKSLRQVGRYLKKFGIPPRPFSTKGLVSWNKGLPMRNESKEKLRIAHTGMKHSNETRAKISKCLTENNPFKGKHHSEESKQKQRDKMVGRKLSPEHRAKVIKSLITGSWGKGEKNRLWKGGISPINARLRRTKEHVAWVRKVKERDGYKCVWCGLVSKNNHADHIAPFGLFPELRLSLDNGRTLCADCHRKTETYGYKSVKVKTQNK